MTASDSANIFPLVSRSKARDDFRLALRLYVGRGRRYSVKQLASGSGVPERMIESFVAPVESEDYRAPCIEHVLSLSAFLGPEFTCEWLVSAGQGAFWLPTEHDIPPGEIAADIAEASAKVTRAAADGKFDKDEKPDLRVVGPKLMAEGARLHAIGRAA